MTGRSQPNAGAASEESTDLARISLQAPSMSRRLAAFVYEGVLLFGVTMAAGYVYATLTQQRHALAGKAGLQAFLFVVLGIYFSWFWSRGGQTVPGPRTGPPRQARTDGRRRPDSGPQRQPAPLAHPPLATPRADCRAYDGAGLPG